jgi:hypothetical protein
VPLGLGNHFRLLGHLNETGKPGGRQYTQTFTVMGPAGAPMRPPYGPFTGKPSGRQYTQTFTVMGPAGAPMRPPYGPFGGKFGPTKNVVVTIMGPAGAPMMPLRNFFLLFDPLTTDNYEVLLDNSGIPLVGA